jgi:hypothetical protein
MTKVDLLCRCCGDVYPSDEGRRYYTTIGCGPGAEMRTYADPPYSWHPDHRLCLTCWLLGDASWKQPFHNAN